MSTQNRDIAKTKLKNSIFRLSVHAVTLAFDFFDPKPISSSLSQDVVLTNVCDYRRYRKNNISHGRTHKKCHCK